MAIGTVEIDEKGEYTRYTNTSTLDDEEVIVTGDIGRHNTFEVMSVTGAVDVYASLDGTNYSSAPLSLVDQGATDLAPVLVTTAGRMYGFRGLYAKLKVLQNDATDVAVSLRCGRI